MPLSSNAPFNEFGQSMILRDIEQLYLSLNAAGSGSPGDGATQDQTQSVTQDTGEGGLSVDLSGLATIEYVDQQDNDIYEYVDAAIAGIPEYPFSAALSVVGNATNIAGVANDISASGNGQVFQRNGDALAFTSDLALGTGQRTATATNGSIDIAISTDGDAVRISDSEDGISIYDRSVSSTTPLIKLSLGHASLNATGRQLSIRTVDVCDATSGTVKSILILGSDTF